MIVDDKAVDIVLIDTNTVEGAYACLDSSSGVGAESVVTDMAVVFIQV